jgi:hypothetical protein
MDIFAILDLVFVASFPFTLIVLVHFQRKTLRAVEALRKEVRR